MTPLAMTGGGEAERSAGAGKGRGDEEEVVVVVEGGELGLCGKTERGGA